MELYPAIDLKDGNCVRLYQGDFDLETRYGSDPAAQARIFDEAGAEWIHVVDLDAARSGVAGNLEHIADICNAVSAKVQSGGGVRNMKKAEALLAAGVERVVVGTAAMEDPSFVHELAERYPGQVAVGLDARYRPGNTPAEAVWDVAVRGWQDGTGQDLITTAKEFEDRGVAALIVTEIGRDGTLEGPDTDGLAKVLEATTLDVIASGGVGSLADLAELGQLTNGERSLSGVIVGKALYENRFNVSEALQALR